MECDDLSTKEVITRRNVRGNSEGEMTAVVVQDFCKLKSEDDLSKPRFGVPVAQ